MEAKECGLCNPNNARRYLSEFRVDGKEVTFVTLADGRTIHFADMTDDQAVNFAHQFYEMERGRRPAH